MKEFIVKNKKKLLILAVFIFVTGLSFLIYSLIFTDKKEELELCDIKVMLSWSFDTRRYTFGDNGTTYLDDNGKPQKPKSGCATPIATLVLCLSLCCLLYLVAVIG